VKVSKCFIRKQKKRPLGGEAERWDLETGSPLRQPGGFLFIDRMIPSSCSTPLSPLGPRLVSQGVSTSSIAIFRMVSAVPFFKCPPSEAALTAVRESGP
jgi:hypothetical protein